MSVRVKIAAWVGVPSRGSASPTPRSSTLYPFSDAVRPAPRIQIWAGWFPQLAPMGVPRGGVLLDRADEVEIPLCPGYPWLLANVLSASEEAAEQIAPTVPIVAFHPVAIAEPCTVTLTFSPANSSVPVLTALPSLRHAR